MPPQMAAMPMTAANNAERGDRFRGRRRTGRGQATPSNGRDLTERRRYALTRSAAECGRSLRGDASVAEEATPEEATPGSAILAVMGLDPTRPHRRRPSDLIYVGAGLAVVIALVVWALLG